MMPEHWMTAYRPVAWAMRIPGCDGSADWVELGEDQPAPNAPAVASPLYDKDGLDRAVAAERERCAHEVDVALGHALEDGYSVESVQAIMGVRYLLRGPNAELTGPPLLAGPVQ